MHRHRLLAMDRDEVWRLVEAYRDAWVGHDLNGLLELVTPDVVFHNHTAAERVEGAVGFGEHVAQIHARWPDTQFTERRVHLGEEFAVVEWTASARRTDGRQVEWDGIDVIELRGARICANYVYSSSHAPRMLDSDEPE
ncbi:MAG TPA: nuclear transport factor 2 family protein [Vicinamibacterales bacterium]|jgi:ketosteroid isomerase-like protein